jgi:hypothetical protein
VERCNIDKIEHQYASKNMPTTEAAQACEFSNWLLRVGEGKEQTYSDPISGSKDLIKLPEDICKKLTESELIHITYPNLKTK